MAQRFRWTRRGYVAQLEKAEVRLLRGLIRDVITLLEGRQEDVGDDLASPTDAGAASAADAAGADTDAATSSPDSPVAVAVADAAGTADSTPEADADGPAAGLSASDTAFWDLVEGLHLSADPRPHRAAPSDPALARLLPDALAEADEEERQAHRALTEDALTATKLDDARRALAALQSTQVTLPHEEAPAFARALNDVRLVLSTRLGIASEEDARRVHAVDDWRRAADVESTMALLYNFTSWLLETLMDEMLSELPLEGVDGEDA